MWKALGQTKRHKSGGELAAQRKTALLLHKSGVSHQPAGGGPGREEEVAAGRGAPSGTGRVSRAGGGGRVVVQKHSCGFSSLSTLHQQSGGRGAKEHLPPQSRKCFKNVSSPEKTAGRSFPQQPTGHPLQPAAASWGSNPHPGTHTTPCPPWPPPNRPRTLWGTPPTACSAHHRHTALAPHPAYPSLLLFLIFSSFPSSKHICLQASCC